MYGLGVERLLAPLLGGVTDDMRLSPPEVELIRPQVMEAWRTTLRPALIFWLTLVATGGLLTALRMWRDGPSVNPILDDLAFWRFGGVGLLAMTALGYTHLVLRPRLTRRRMGPQAVTYDRYMGSLWGWLPRRSAVLYTVLCTPLTVLSLYAIAIGGQRVDANGFLGTGSWLPGRHGFADVASIEVYSQLNAPIGLRVTLNLVVRFKDGTRFAYMMHRHSNGPAPQRVAEYVSFYSQVPIVFGTVRP